MKRPSRPALGLVLALAATGALCAALAGQAAAATPQISAFGSAGQGRVNSSYLAGYQVTEPGISRASVQFDVPAPTCSATTEGTAEGIGNEAVEGAPTLLGIVFDACVSGSPDHEIQATAGADSEYGTAAAGDRIKVLVVQTSTKVTVTVTDVTSATTVTASGTPTPDNTMTIGSFPLFAGPKLPVADFGRVRMLKPTIENTGLSAWSPTKLNRKTGATVQITSGLFGPTGAFALNYQNH